MKSHSEKYQERQKKSHLNINDAMEIQKTPIVLSTIEEKIDAVQASNEQGMGHEAGDKVSSTSMGVRVEHLLPNPTDRKSETEDVEGGEMHDSNKCNSEFMEKNGSRLSDSSKSGLVSVSPSSSSLSSEDSGGSKPLKKKPRKSKQSASVETVGEIKYTTSTELRSPFLSGTNTVVSPTFTSLNTRQPQNQLLQVQIGRQRSNSVPNDYYSRNTKIPNLNLSSSRVQSQLEPQKQAKRQHASSQSTGKSGQLRRGKWTVEEEAYVARVIQDFNSGYLKASAGTTLRTYLSDKLNCDPMRITKKFTGDACIGKRVFHPAVRCSSNAVLIDKAQVRFSNKCCIILTSRTKKATLTHFNFNLFRAKSELDVLEQRWRRRLEVQQREAAKKQAASAAAATAAAMSGRIPLLAPTPTPTLSTLPHAAFLSTVNPIGQSAVIAQTASWLDRANAILSNKQAISEEQKIQARNGKTVQKEMEEVQRLIYEGPIIQKTSKGLTKLLEGAPADATNAPLVDQSTTRKVPEGPGTNKAPMTPTISVTAVGHATDFRTFTADSNISVTAVGVGHATDFRTFTKTNTNTIANNNCHSQEKRMRRAYSANHISSLADVSAGAAEDAATLMSFLTSVREAAASKPSNNNAKVVTKK
jgi:hypothetical protein